MPKSASKFNAPASPPVWASADKATARAKPALAAWRAAMTRLAAAVATGDRPAADFAAADVGEHAEAVAKALGAPAELYPTAVRPGMSGGAPLLKCLAADLTGPDGEVLLATLTGAVPAA